jgi:2,3-bisphosphoglycerate-independent phosphoglycerate mutase
LKKAFSKAKKQESSIHLIGLLSDGNVHSSIDTMFALLRMAKNEGCGNQTFIHGILDGRDVPTRTADVYVEAIQIKMAEIGCGRIATLCGRHYAMDRSQHWERTARAYTMLVHAEGERAFDPIDAIRGSYLRGITDEFVQPIVLEEKPGTPVASIKNGDLVIFFNHRADRMRQLVASLAISGSDKRSTTGKPEIESLCMVEYHENFKLPVAFAVQRETNVLGQVFADHGVINCRLAESENYDHVTYFFNGGSETELPGEKRMLIPSPKSARNGGKAEVACFDVTNALLRGLEAGKDDVFIVNLASADVFAKTGNFEKTIEAVELVDACIGEIIKKTHEVDGVTLITSDHGNCEEMSVSDNGKPTRFVTANPVPFHFVANNLNGLKLREDGALEDVAPTILGILGIEKPLEMTGTDLRVPG